MNDIDRELREALQRKQPPAGFHRRVMERAVLSRRSLRRWRWIPAAVAACLLISVSGAYWQRQREAERAKEQLIEALQITGRTLTLVQQVAVKSLGSRQEQ